MSLIALFSFSSSSHADQGLGTGELPQFAPDGKTPLHMVADGTVTGTLIGGSRYIGWLQNSAQGVLFDRITRQSWYIYRHFGEPGEITWYAQMLPDPMPEWVDEAWPRS